MSVTKLKTVGNWHATYWKNNAVAELRTNPSGRDAGGDRGAGAVTDGDWHSENVRGRVITGMLTGGDVHSDVHAVDRDQPEERT